MARVYGILKILRSAHVSNTSRRESRYLWWPKSHTHTSKLAQCMSDRGATWFPAWCLTSRSSSPAYSRKTELSQFDLCCHQRSQSSIPDTQMHRQLQHVHLPPGLLIELQVEEGTCRILVFDQFIWRPNVEASSFITVSARTRTSNISASKQTSSAKSKSVNTSFLRVTPVIPRCTVRSIIWSIGPRNRSGAILQPCRPPLPTANQSDITPSTLTQLHMVYWIKCNLQVNKSNQKWLLKLFPTLDDSVQSEDSICRWPSGCEPTLLHSTL